MVFKVLLIMAAFVSLLGFVGGLKSGVAEETVAPPAPTPTPETTAPSAAVPKKGVKKAREQKDTEGSEAPGRFEADTILKSQYQLNGQPLEVDPD